MDAIARIALFLLNHADLVDLLISAIEGGASKDLLMKAVKDAMVEASNVEMKAELGS